MSEPNRATLPRRVVLTGALATAGGVLVAGRAGAAPAPEPDFLDLARPEVREARHWLTLRLEEAGDGAAVPLHLGTTADRPAQVTVRTTTHRVTVGAERSGGGRSVEATVSPGRTTVLWVTPKAVGRPDEPADRIVVSGLAGGLTVEAYVVPVGGRWEWAGPDGTELDLEIVAVHAALLRGKNDNLEVEMYSPPRKTNRKGQPVRNPSSHDNPKEWWWLRTDMVHVESRRLDLRTLTTQARPMNLDLPKGAHSENLFCSGQAHLPDGRLLTAGSHVHHDQRYGRHVFVYDQDSSYGWRLLPHAVFTEPRWYPTITQLPDGRMLIASGSTDAPWKETDYWDHINNDYRILDPTTEEWADLGGGQRFATLIDEKRLRALRGDRQRLATYPHIFVLPGRTDTDTVVAMVETNLAWLYTYARGGALKSAGDPYPMNTTGSRSYITMGSAVVLPYGPKPGPMHILVMGGQDETATNHRDTDPEQPSTDTAELFTLDPARSLRQQRKWEWVGRLRHSRLLCDATLLADGGVLVSGGATTGWSDRNMDPVRQSELYDAASRTFRPAATQRTDRRYHSTALLMPDGSVFKAGSTGGFAENDNDAVTWIHSHTSAERYWPEYAYAHARPVLAPLTTPTVRHGGTLTLTVSGPTVDDKVRVAVIRLGAVTHNNNMDQRYVWLATTATGGGERRTVTARLPKNPAAAPGGDYMLVAVDRAGVPSHARLLRVELD